MLGTLNAESNTLKSCIKLKLLLKTPVLIALLMNLLWKLLDCKQRRGDRWGGQGWPMFFIHRNKKPVNFQQTERVKVCISCYWHHYWTSHLVCPSWRCPCYCSLVLEVTNKVSLALQWWETEIRKLLCWEEKKRTVSPSQGGGVKMNFWWLNIFFVSGHPNIWLLAPSLNYQRKLIKGRYSINISSITFS